MTVDEEFNKRNLEYRQKLAEDLAFIEKHEVMEEWDMTEEEYEEIFGDEATGYGY